MTASPQFTHIACDQDEAVLVITLNRPDQMNALSQEMEAELHSALSHADAEPSIRSVLLTGAGRAFSAGYDLDSAEGHGPTRAETLRHYWDINLRTLDNHFHVMNLTKPVVAAINGWCLGGGFWYALVADVTFASDKAVFGQPEVREVMNSSFLFAAISGWKNAHRYGLTGDHFDAEEAVRIGVANEVVPHDELMTRSLELAKRLALVPPDAVRLNKAITVLGLEAMGLRTAMTTGSLLSMIVHSSADAEDVREIQRIRDESGLKESLAARDDPFLPEPGGPRSARAKA